VRNTGLKAVYDVRDARARGRYNRPSGAMWLVGGGAALASLVMYFFVSTRALSVQREKLLAKRRAVESTLGVRWSPLRDRVESWVLQKGALDYEGDFVDAGAARLNLQTRPGIYLRLRKTDTIAIESLRKAAAESKRDAFVACFFSMPAASSATTIADAGAENQPWNLQQAYVATRILGNEWLSEVRQADDKLRLRVFEDQYDKAVKDEIPTAIDLLQHAEFFTLVIDDDRNTDVHAKHAGDAISEAVLQLVQHPVYVYGFDLKSGTELLRLKMTAGNATFEQAGEHAVTDPEMRNAMQRQVNNCSLGQQAHLFVVRGSADTHLPNIPQP